MDWNLTKSMNIGSQLILMKPQYYIYCNFYWWKAVCVKSSILLNVMRIIMHIKCISIVTFKNVLILLNGRNNLKRPKASTLYQMWAELPDLGKESKYFCRYSSPLLQSLSTSVSSKTWCKFFSHFLTYKSCTFCTCSTFIISYLTFNVKCKYFYS